VSTSRRQHRHDADARRRRGRPTARLAPGVAIGPSVVIRPHPSPSWRSYWLGWLLGWSVAVVGVLRLGWLLGWSSDHPWLSGPTRRRRGRPTGSVGSWGGHRTIRGYQAPPVAVVGVLLARLAPGVVCRRRGGPTAGGPGARLGSAFSVKRLDIWMSLDHVNHM